jgi:hypothetical protein
VPKRVKQNNAERGSVSRRSDSAVNKRVNESEAQLHREELGIQEE